MNNIIKNTSAILIFSPLCSFFSETIYAQKENPVISKMYLQTGGGATSYEGVNGDILFKTIIKNKWSASVSYTSAIMKPENQPEDYQAESGVVFFLIPYRNEVQSKLNLVSATFGKYIPVGKKCWFTAEAGISFVDGERINYQPAPRQSSDPIWLIFGMQSTSSNYITSVEKVNSIGGMLRADFNYAAAPFLGLGAGVFTSLNSIQSPVGFQFTISLGWMNTGRRKK